MRFRVGAAPENPEFQPEAAGWSGLHEPDPVRLPLALLLIGLATFFCLGLLLARTGELSAVPRPSAERGTDPNWLRFGLVVLVLFPAHELVHALCCPQQGRSPKTTMGFWPSRGVFYVHHDAPMSRGRYLGILAAPFLVLSLTPIALIVLLRGYLPPDVLFSLGMLSLFNGAASAGDLLYVGLIGARVPPAAQVRCQGSRLFWKGPGTG